MTSNALPPVVDADAWQRDLDALRGDRVEFPGRCFLPRAQRRRMPMVRMPDYTLEGAEGPVRLADVFGGRSQLIGDAIRGNPGVQAGD